MRTVPDAGPRPDDQMSAQAATAVDDPDGSAPQGAGGGWTTRASLLVGSAAIAFGVSDALNRWLLAGRGLRAETDVVGYPTYANFNSYHYTQLFLLAVAVFPVVLVVSYVVLDRVLPRVLDRFGSRVVVEGFGIAGRLAVPGVALGLAGAVAAQSSGRAVWSALLLGVLGYALLVALGALLLAARRPRRSFARRLALVNTLSVPSTIGCLAVVSAATTVTLVDTGRVVSHSFLSWPVAVLGVLAVLGIVAHRVRRVSRGSLEDVRRLEFTTVTLVAGSVIVFLVTASLPGALGPFDAFHEGEGLGTATFLREGAFPWRDVLFIHGPLLDGLWPMLGLSVFEDSRWGMDAGAHMLVVPLCYVLVWVLLARTVRRNWAVLAGFPIVLLAGGQFFGGVLLIGPPAARMAFLPLVVLVLARTVRSLDRPWAFGLGALAFVVFVLTPELSFGVVAVIVALVGFELTSGSGLPWARRMRRTVWCAAGGLTSAAVFVGWLGLHGAIDDFFFYFRTFAPDHTLTGSFPVNLPEQGTEFIFAAALPFGLALVTGSYLAWRLTTRRPILPTDWAMASLALLGLLIYPKFLARPDGHVFMGVVIGFPLLVYTLARILEPGDQDIEQAAPGRAPRHLLSAAVVGALLLTAVPPAARDLAEVPSRFTPDVQTDRASARLGYATVDALPACLIDDLEVAVGAVGPDTRLFDFTNQPGIVHYLLGLALTTRYPHVSMAIREPNQADLIDELAADPPELALYWSNSWGLATWDGIVNPVRHYDVSQWLLEHYEQWFAMHGDVLYIRRDLDKPDPASFADRLTVEPIIDDADALLPPCAWGTSPVFLDDDGQVATDGTTLSGTPADRTATFVGWAGSMAGVPVTRVLAVSPDGTVLNEAPATGARPDLAEIAPAGEAGGFAITVPLAADERPEDVRIVAVSSDSVAASIGVSPALAPGTRLAYSSGRTAVGMPGGATGAIDHIEVTALAAGVEVLRLDVPEGATDTFDWLELSVAGEPTPGTFSLTDVYGGSATRSIQFQTIDRGVDRYLVQGASCAQWHDFTGGTLYLQHSSSAPVTITLQRSQSPPGHQSG